LNSEFQIHHSLLLIQIHLFVPHVHSMHVLNLCRILFVCSVIFDVDHRHLSVLAAAKQNVLLIIEGHTGDGARRDLYGLDAVPVRVVYKSD